MVVMGLEGSRTVRNWRAVAEETARETDPKKFQRLVRELCAALDEREKHPQETPEREP